MDYSELLRHVDHTLLTPTATWDQVKTVCDEGLDLPHCLRLHPAPLCEAGRRLCGQSAEDMHRGGLPQRLLHP